MPIVYHVEGIPSEAMDIYEELVANPLDELFGKAANILNTAHAMCHDGLKDPDFPLNLRNVAEACREARSTMEEAFVEAKAFDARLATFLNASLMELASSVDTNPSEIDKYCGNNTVIGEHPVALDLFEIAKVFSNESWQAICTFPVEEFEVHDDAIYTTRQVMLRYVYPLKTIADAPANYIIDSFQILTRFIKQLTDSDNLDTRFNALEDLLSDEVSAEMADPNFDWGTWYQRVSDNLIPLKDYPTSLQCASLMLKKLLPGIADTYVVMQKAIDHYKEDSAITF